VPRPMLASAATRKEVISISGRVQTRLIVAIVLIASLGGCGTSRRNDEGSPKGSMPRPIQEMSQEQLRAFCIERAVEVLGRYDLGTVDGGLMSPGLLIESERFLGATNPTSPWGTLEPGVEIIACRYQDIPGNATSTTVVCPDGAVASFQNAIYAYYSSEGERLFADWQPSPIGPYEPCKGADEDGK